MVEQFPAEIEQMLDAGEWLKGGQIAILFGRDPATIYRWVSAGRFGYRQVGGQREYDPADVRRELDEARQVRRSTGEQPDT
jgi:hypothetical protein